MDSWTARALTHGDFHVAEEPAAYDDARPTVYLDTSIPSYLTSRISRDLVTARRQRITRMWWARYRGNYSLWIPKLVLAEAENGDCVAAQEQKNALIGLHTLFPLGSSEALVGRLIDEGILPAKARADAEHIAIAATNSMRFLLTWNCKHLANPIILERVVRTCEDYGFCCPEICTPEELMRAYAHERRPTA